MTFWHPLSGYFTTNDGRMPADVGVIQTVLQAQEAALSRQDAASRDAVCLYRKGYMVRYRKGKRGLPFTNYRRWCKAQTAVVAEGARIEEMAQWFEAQP